MACIVELGEPVFIVRQQSQREHWMKFTPIEAVINTEYGLAGIITEKGKLIGCYEWEVFWKYEPEDHPSDLLDLKEFPKLRGKYGIYPVLPIEIIRN